MDFNRFDVSAKELIWDGPAAWLDRLRIGPPGPAEASLGGRRCPNEGTARRAGRQQLPIRGGVTHRRARPVGRRESVGRSPGRDHHGGDLALIPRRDDLQLVLDYRQTYRAASSASRPARRSIDWLIP